VDPRTCLNAVVLKLCLRVNARDGYLDLEIAFLCFCVTRFYIPFCSFCFSFFPLFIRLFLFCIISISLFPSFLLCLSLFPFSVPHFLSF
jgi:hypothetical protein